MFIIMCIIVICIFYQCRSKDKVTATTPSPYPSLKRVIDRSAMFLAKKKVDDEAPILEVPVCSRYRSALFLANEKVDDETPILEVPAMASLHTSPQRLNVVKTSRNKDLTMISNYDDLVMVSAKKL